MPNYEAAFYLLPTVEEAAVISINEKFSSQISQWGGEKVKVTSHGKKRLAYSVKGREEGYFVVIEFTGNPQAAKELNRVLRITDEVLRAMVVRVDQPPPAVKPAAAPPLNDAPVAAQEKS